MTHPNTQTVTDAAREDTDAELLWQAAAHAEALLEVLADGEPVTAPLRPFLGYLREVVLARIGDEERAVLPALRGAGLSVADIDHLHEDHLALRAAIDKLAEAAAAPQEPQVDQMAAVVRRLIVRLDEHPRGEAAALSALPGGYRPDDFGWAAAEHWSPLTEGPSIDLDLLRPDLAEDAVLTRLTQLRTGEQVQLRSRARPEHLWHRLQRRDPDGYAWAEDSHADNGWTAAIARRRTDAP